MRRRWNGDDQPYAKHGQDWESADNWNLASMDAGF